MKQKDIDERIKEITKEAEQLGEQRNALELLNKCAAQGHIMNLADYGYTGIIAMNWVRLRCEVCGCEALIESEEPQVLVFPQGHAFSLDKVSEVYEIEDTAPLEAANPLLPQPEESNIEHYPENENVAPANLRGSIKDYIRKKENEKDEDRRF